MCGIYIKLGLSVTVYEELNEMLNTELLVVGIKELKLFCRSLNVENITS